MSLRTPKLRLGLLLLLTPMLLWLLLLIILPHVNMAIISLSERVSAGEYAFSLSNYAEFFTESLYWNTFLRTATMSILVTFLTLIIAFPVSYYIAKMLRGRTKGLVFALCLIPFWVSELVRTYGWMILLRETGVVSSSLQWLGLTDGPIEFLYNDAAIIAAEFFTDNPHGQRRLAIQQSRTTRLLRPLFNVFPECE